MKLKVKKKQIRLKDLEPGRMFLYGKTLGLKTEYKTPQGACEAFIVGSGEMFWGGSGTTKEREELLVNKVKVKNK
jgi:hypothetical protein